MRIAVLGAAFAVALSISGCASLLKDQSFQCSPGMPQRIDADQAIRPPRIDSQGYKTCE